MREKRKAQKKSLPERKTVQRDRQQDKQEDRIKGK